MSELSKPEPWVNTKEIAVHMGVTVETVRKWIKLEKYLATASASCGSLKSVRLTSG